MKSFIEGLRAARHIELILLIVLLAALGLLMISGLGGAPADRTDAEARLERLIERIEGVGDADVMISTDAEGNPVGAAVVVSGTLDVRARLEIQSAIQALLDIELKRIRVIGRGGLEG